MTHDTQSTSATVTPTEDLSKKHVKLKFEVKVRCLFGFYMGNYY